MPEQVLHKASDLYSDRIKDYNFEQISSNHKQSTKIKQIDPQNEPETNNGQIGSNYVKGKKEQHVPNIRRVKKLKNGKPKPEGPDIDVSAEDCYTSSGIYKGRDSGIDLSETALLKLTEGARNSVSSLDYGEGTTLLERIEPSTKQIVSQVNKQETNTWQANNNNCNSKTISTLSKSICSISTKVETYVKKYNETEPKEGQADGQLLYKTKLRHVAKYGKNKREMHGSSDADISAEESDANSDSGLDLSALETRSQNRINVTASGSVSGDISSSKTRSENVVIFTKRYFSATRSPYRSVDRSLTGKGTKQRFVYYRTADGSDSPVERRSFVFATPSKIQVSKQINNNEYSNLLQTFQNVTCYKQPYFDYSKSFPLDKFVCQNLENFNAKGFTAIAITTQLHQYDRPLPFEDLRFSSIINVYEATIYIRSLKHMLHKTSGLKDENFIKAKIYTNLVLIYVRQKKLGRASKYLGEAKHLLSQAEASEFTAWYHVAAAMFYEEYAISSTRLQISRIHQITFGHLQAAKDHFQKEMGKCKNFQLEGALTIWWMILNILNMGKFYNRESSATLSESDIKRAYDCLTPEKQDQCRRLFIQFKKELSEIDEKQTHGISYYYRKFNIILSADTNDKEGKYISVMSKEKLKKRKTYDKPLLSRIIRLQADDYSSTDDSEDSQNMQKASAKPINIEEEYTHFKDAMFSKRAPPYVLTSRRSVKSGKIYVDVRKECEKEAHVFFLAEVPDQMKKGIIKIVPQVDMDFIGDNLPEGNCVADGKSTVPYLAKKYIQVGNELLGLREIQHDVSNMCRDHKSFEDIRRACIGDSIPTGSSAGFVEDQKGKVYKLSACHPFSKREQEANIDRMVPKPDRESDIHLPVITEILTTNDKGDNEGKLVHIGDRFWGALTAFESKPGKRVAVDIGLIKVNHNLLQDQRIQFCPKNRANECVHLSVYDGDDKSIVDNIVQKSGPVTMKTKGKIVLGNREIYVDGFPCEGCFAIQALKLEGKTSSTKFSQRGDSGSLVTDELEEVKSATAYGIVFKKQGFYRDEETDEEFEDITWCVTLRNCFQFAKKDWKMDLKFYTPARIRDSKHQDAQNGDGSIAEQGQLEGEINSTGEKHKMLNLPTIQMAEVQDQQLSPEQIEKLLTQHPQPELTTIPEMREINSNKRAQSEDSDGFPDSGCGNDFLSDDLSHLELQSDESESAKDSGNPGVEFYRKYVTTGDKHVNTE